MADSTLKASELVLNDLWPGQVNPHLTLIDNVTNGAHHNVQYATHPVGTKASIYCKAENGTYSRRGFATFIYLQASVNPNAAMAAGQVCVPQSAVNWFGVTNDPDDALSVPGMPVVVALSAMTTGYYGWFWCGGVCPVEAVPALDSATAFATDGDVAPGPVTARDLEADAIGFGSLDGTDPKEVAVGFALAASR